MRQNYPVTQKAYEFPDSAVLMSVTDEHSHITYANEAFVEVSGYTYDELMGQPHNLVRHPDMPPQAFADMWATMKSGQAWTGLVKNRRKNGDHYWVRANATPIQQDGKIIGYLSVRTKPTPAEITEAEQLYQRFREQRAGGRVLYRGRIMHSGWLRWRSWPQTASMRSRVLGILLLGTAPQPLLAHWLQAWPDTVWVQYMAVLLAVGTMWGLLSWQFLNPIKRITHQAQKTASGQPSQVHDLDRVDEVGMLNRAVNQSALNLRALVEDVAKHAKVVGGSSQSIASSSTDLSDRTQRQMGALEESAASMLQFGLTIQMNADSAKASEQLAQDAREVVGKGQAVVKEMIGTMGQVSAASGQITSIVNMIDSLAFQTNILALNASVEAARAGELGAGFSVVATEVRQLANRSAAAAKDIRNIIESNVELVSQGRTLAQDTHQTMHEVAESIGNLTEAVHKIIAGSREQSEGVHHVNKAIEMLEETTQSNAAMVEHNTYAAQQLKERAQHLINAIHIFSDRTHTQQVSHASVTPQSPRARSASARASSPANTSDNITFF